MIMSKKAFDQIMEGLTEALAVARGEAKPAKLHVPAATGAEPAHVWATVEIKHTNHGWHDGLIAHLESSHGFWCWKLQAKTAGISVDRALSKARFRSVPTALEWAERSKFARNLKVLREWKDDRAFYLGRLAADRRSREGPP
jgi:hypothetical protein